MNTFIQQNQAAAEFIARVFLGFLFFFQGYDAVFKIKINNIIRTYQYSFSEKGIPEFITACGAFFTSYVELIAGSLLIIGLFEYDALILLGIDLIIASIGFGIMKPMWDMRYVFPRLILLLFLLTVPPSWHQFSIDNLIINLNK